MDEDMSDIFQKLNSILADKETSENLKNILSNYSSSNTSNSNHSQNDEDSSNATSSSNFNSGIPDFDINMILKLKSIMDTMNNSKNDPRANLLQSLKPYLKDSKKEKVDQYIKFLNIAKVIETLDITGGENKKNE